MTTYPDDPAARALLRAATEGNYRWPPGVSGFAAQLTGSIEDAGFSGRLDAPSARALTLAVALPADELRWLHGEVASIIGHRLHRTFDEGDGRYGITAEPAGAHTYGQLLRLHGDPFQSTYRVQGGLLREASRVTGERHFTLSVHSAQQCGAQTIAQHYSVAHFASEGGRLLRSDVYTDEYVEVAGVWLPALRRVVSATDAGLSVRAVQFSAHTLHRAEAGVAPGEYERLRGKM